MLPEKTTKEKHDEDMAAYLRSEMTGDEVSDHERAEEILLLLLAEMDYHKLVEAFEDEARRFWYA
jgi:hypothetical protein